jgi:hypothetical protein
MEKGGFRVKRLILLSALGCIPWLAAARGDAGKTSEAATCGSYGTSVHFEATPSDAARKALKEQKLVFVLHVSGNFENSDFT